MNTSEPHLSIATYRGSHIVIIEHRGRRVEVSFSPRGKNVRVWVDEEEISEAPTVVRVQT